MTSRKSAELGCLTPFFHACNTAVALRADIALRYDDVQSYLSVTVDPKDYQSCQTFAIDWCVKSYLKKYAFYGISKKQLDDAALSSLKAGESQCSTTNSELSQRLRGNPEFEATFRRARNKIASVLGQLPVGRVLSDSDWTNGATYDHKRGVSVGKKMTSLPFTVTRPALKYAKAFLETDYGWFESLSGTRPVGSYCILNTIFKIVPGNKWMTVPKDARTARNICKEPTLNVFLQRGVGVYIRRRLKRYGVDIRDQSQNQRLAKLAFSSALSTLDLENASNTIAWRLIAELLPHDWFVLLDDLRSERTLVNGVWQVNEMFSSMGNGFTFELETLVFWALASSCEGVSTCGVYGDDIIVDRCSYDRVTQVLNLCGFSVNESKSFRDGPFFESCGKHYFEGRDVTPFYQKRRLTTRRGWVYSELIRFHNRLMRWIRRVELPVPVYAETLTICTHLVDAEYGTNVLRIPFGCESDGGLLSNDLTPTDSNGFLCWQLKEKSGSRRDRQKPKYSLYLRKKDPYNPTIRDIDGLERDPLCLSMCDSGHSSFELVQDYIPELLTR